MTSTGDLAMVLMIRHFELNLLDLFDRGELAGTTHTCLGQEYIPVALAPLLANDFIFSNHRGHGHYLAHFNDPAGLLAEVLGRTGAVCGGVGGSQHILREGFLSTGVQGQSLPLAVGAALNYKRRGEPRVAVAYIGDGTWGEGSVYEALNMARLWSVPLVVVVEHNKIAQSTPTSQQMAGTVEKRAHAFDIDHHGVSSVDIPAIRADLAPRIARVRTDHVPLVIEFYTTRVGPHSKGDDCRDEAELRRARDLDWYPRYAAQYGERFEAVDAEKRALIARISDEVRARPLSTWERPW